MNFKEAVEEMKKLLGKETYFSVRAEFTHNCSGKETVEIDIYSSNTTWTSKRSTFKEAVEFFKKEPKNKLEGVVDPIELSDPPEVES